MPKGFWLHALNIWRNMAKIYLHCGSDEMGWIFGSMVRDFVSYTSHKLVSYDNADICWFLSPWALQKVAKDKLCFVSIHHIDDLKLERWKFDYIRKHADACFVPNMITETAVQKHIGIPTHIFPYWLAGSMKEVPVDIWKPFRDNIASNGEILIGSLQKDSEGSSNKPKLCKGPDRFLDIVTRLNKEHNIKVVLSGYNRRYLIEGLERQGISYSYFEKIKDINILYACLDWYLVTSRIEGGPQAVLEAPFHRVKILSYPVGMAPDVLHSDCICNSQEGFLNKFIDCPKTLVYNYNNVMNNFSCCNSIRKIDDFFDGLICK